MFMDVDCIEVHQHAQKELGASYVITDLLAFQMCGFGVIIQRRYSGVV